MFYKYLHVFYPDNEYGKQIKQKLIEFSKHYDKIYKTKWNHELHSEK